MTLTDIAVGLAILVGIAGVLVPVLPGALLIAAALVVWALEVGTTTAWVVCAVGVTALVIGSIVKFLIPGRQLKATVPTSTMWFGALAAIVGFFVIPVVGALAGFPLGVYLAERRRQGPGPAAWESTKAALRAVGVSILIEFIAALTAAGAFVVGVVLVRS